MNPAGGSAIPITGIGDLLSPAQSVKVSTTVEQIVHALRAGQSVKLPRLLESSVKAQWPQGDALALGLIRAHILELAAAKVTNSPQATSAVNSAFLQLQTQMQRENQIFTSVSNIMKTKHDTVKNSLGNLR